MSFSKEQAEIVKLVLSHRLDLYYEILLVLRTADANTIKKSYRKLAVKLHPDKNPHPRADEAFKIVNKAWLVLSDDSKKRIFDQTGQDPGSRGGMPSLSFASGFSQARGGPGQGQGQGTFEEEIFNMFFGGGQPGMRGAPSGFSFGNQGFTFQSFGQDPFGRPQQRQRSQQQSRRQQSQQQSQQPQLLLELGRQLLPLLFVIAVPLLLGLFASLGPHYLLQPTLTYQVQKYTPRHKIPYYVSNDYRPSQGDLRNLGRQVEKEYIQDKSQRCQRERMERQRMIDESYGWFFTDETKLARARTMPLPNCLILEEMNLL